MVKRKKAGSIRVLRYISNHLARWEYANVDPTGKLSVRGTDMTWDITKAVPDYLQTGRLKKKREPFFTIRHDLATPVKITIDKDQSTTPAELQQLIFNENLKALTSLPAVEVDRSKMLLAGFIMFFVGMGIMFILTKFLGF